ncbi:FUSC family protein [Gordonia sp. NPDC003585]|uniref:FUSC family protein n=1 Tax=Gordonia sp. NPDC003585 TaxID=3154275 RepID=UPI0033AA1F27
MTAETEPGSPQRPGLRQVLLEVSGVGERAGGAFRAALAVAIPAAVGLANGHGAAAALSALGAFAVVYGERRPYRTRWKVVAGYGLALISCATVGAGVGHLAGAASVGAWIAVIAMMTAVVVLAAIWVDALRERAPGSFLLLLCAELSAVLVLDGTASAPAVVLWTAIGAVVALGVAMTPALLDRHGPEAQAVTRAGAAVDALARQPHDDLLRRRAIHALHEAWDCLDDAGLRGQAVAPTDALSRIHRRLLAVIAFAEDQKVETSVSEEELDLMVLPRARVGERLRWGLRRPRIPVLALRLTVACVVAGGIAIAVDLGRPDWAVITAAMILHQGPDRVTGSWRALNRCVGTVIGVGVLAVITPVLGSAVLLILTVVVLMAGTEIFLVVNYAIAMVFITPLAMTLGALAPQEPLSEAVIGRIAETVIGVGVAVVTLWCVRPRGYRAVLLDSERRVVDAIEAVEADGPADAGRRRRRLEFELEAATTAVSQAGFSDPAWMLTQWPRHHRLHRQGYALLTKQG